MDLTTLFLIIAGIVVVGLIIYFLLKQKKGAGEKPEKGGPETPSSPEDETPPETPTS